MVILFDREQHRIRIYVGVPKLGAIGNGEPCSQRGQKGGSSICKCFQKKGTPGFPGNRAREVLVGPMERRVTRVLTVQKQNVASNEFCTGTKNKIKPL